MRFRSRHREGLYVISTVMRFLSTSGRIAYGARREVLYGHISTIWFRFSQVRWFRFGRSCRASTIIRGRSRLLCAGRERGWPHIRASSAFICSIVGRAEGSIRSRWRTILRCFGHDGKSKVCRKDGLLHTFRAQTCILFQKLCRFGPAYFWCKLCRFSPKVCRKTCILF